MTEDKRNSNNSKTISQEDALKAMAARHEAWDQPVAEVVAHDEPHAEGAQLAMDVTQPFQAVQAQARKPAAHAASHNLKKVMIPLLIVVGGLLLLMGGAVAFLDATGTLKDASETGPLGGPVGRVLVYSAFPLGVILLVGAWLFHREVKQQADRRP